jgi:hypothetical protein
LLAFALGRAPAGPAAQLQELPGQAARRAL